MLIEKQESDFPIEVRFRAMRTTRLPEARKDRRENILNVAQACFLAEGYGATSMSTISARFGGSKATLYNHFKSKEELFSAVVRRFAEQAQRQLGNFPDGSNARAKLLRMAEDCLETLLSPEAIALYRLVVGESDRFPELARLFYEAGPKIRLARYAQILGSMMEVGLLRPEDPALAAQDFNGLLVGGVYLPRLWGVVEVPTPAMASEHAKAAVDTFLRAYAPGTCPPAHSPR